MKTYRFKGKHVLLTGATGGIGSALAQKLAAQDAVLVISSRSEKGLQDLIAYLPEDAQVHAMTADLSVPGDAEKLVQNAVEKLGYVDVFFNASGVGYFALMEESTRDNIRYLFEVNTFSPLAMMNALVPGMKARKSGRMINLVSSAGRVPIPTEGVYGGSKTALAVMANTMRLELAPYGIDILNIYPGTVDTEFEHNAIRENQRPGVCSNDACGVPRFDIAEKIVEAASGPPGEVWLEWEGRLMSAAAIIWPGYMERKLEPFRSKTVKERIPVIPPGKRRWRLLQVESAVGCNLRCIMCPWTEYRQTVKNKGLMPPAIWELLKPYLPQVKSIDFTGSGEPLMNPHLVDWIADTETAGCDAGFQTNGMPLFPKKAREVLDAGIDWIAFSMDGATADVFENIRRGADFKRVCENISAVTGFRVGKHPRIIINFVIMKNNAHQMEDMVRLSAELGVDQLNFSQCDVIRKDHGKDFGLFSNQETRETRELEKALNRAKRLARKFQISTTSFAFTPEELPVCDQDPRNAMYVRHDGSVSPCSNLASGGTTTFLGRQVEMPTVRYGNLTDHNLKDLWRSQESRFYRDRFQKRINKHDAVISQGVYDSPSKLKAAFEDAVAAMPEAPEGCRVCHYLYDI
jgi:short-subunit dehydrogenase/MoaA/NifB/PqqE/SkfB family radical SAM enzyme